VRLTLLFVLALAACRGSDPAKRQRELAQCQVASRTPQELVHCLAIERNWPADSANAEGLRAQAMLDSLERDKLAEQATAFNVRADSVMKLYYATMNSWIACGRKAAQTGSLYEVCGSPPEVSSYVDPIAAEHRSLAARCEEMRAQKCLDVLESGTVFAPRKHSAEKRP